MKKSAAIKKIIKESEDKDVARIFESLEKEGEGDLKNFLVRLGQVKKRVEPERMLAIKILHRLLEPATNQEASRLLDSEGTLRSTSFPSKLKIQLHMPKILQVAIPVVLLVLAGLVVLVNPFDKENLQVAELKDIVSDENTVNELASSFDNFLAEENQMGEIDSFLNQIALSGPSVPDTFSLSQIESESNMVNFDSDLNAFFSQEENLGEVDSLLINF
ncbi:MAG: hypothetical protein UV58_C0002G0011 [Candidatus Wolfebacteria bacterium GW2011_GWC1_43_10]|uniref:Uncharacterized protein n=1 Tax=Candidatus Wolfebacteria bacterium GW2011_GWC1_43_10 TaxID=1619011 RepID=A0A0G1EIZ4_9BACT|nr:MAG: hypothetical protein UV58_C0002G0011 [Candidatus Wolfebacteria bacterium GW2011_GWC1_43_10]KKT23058.1 MAG: hypothetical protein UW08_C0001G0021 [Parcubacteria group bacterium GW2011_GWB1_43_8b]